MAIAERTASQMSQTSRAIKSTGASVHVFAVGPCELAQAEVFIALATDETRDDRASFSSINRIAQIGDIASAAYYLSSGSAS